MWERFGYYLMIGIFQLYMTESLDKGGFGFSREQAADIYGTFIALVFLTPFIGGLLADRILGYTKSVFIGGTLMGLGYLGLSVHQEDIFYLSLLLIIAGNGFFKPNISTLLGNLYSQEDYKSLKDSGFSIFYMGINVGACICNFFAAFMRNKYGWGWAFATAGVGMFLGLLVFYLGLRHYKAGNILKPLKPGDMPLSYIFSTVLLPALGAGIGGWLIPGNLLGSDSTDAFIFAAIPVVIFYISLWFRSGEEEKKPIGALLVIMLVSVLFWAVFKQNGTALTTWAQYYTDREVPEAVAPVADGLCLAEKQLYTKDSTSLYDSSFRLVKEGGKAVKTYDYPVYFRNVEPKPEEGSSFLLYNTELFQSINPFWVVVLTPVVVAFFAWTRRRGKEPSTAGKIAWGLLISALSTLVMVAAVEISSNGAIKASSWWLIACYGVITVGELCLSPMGLSLVSKVSPPRLTALLMGGWFLATSIGNKLSGVLASLWDRYPDKTGFFMVNFTLLAGATVLMVLLLKFVKRSFGNKV